MTTPNLYAEAVVESFRLGEYLVATFERGRDVDLANKEMTKCQPRLHKLNVYLTVLRSVRSCGCGPAETITCCGIFERSFESTWR